MAAFSPIGGSPEGALCGACRTGARTGVPKRGLGCGTISEDSIRVGCIFPESVYYLIGLICGHV
jgi:hypothetical protein